MKKVYLAPTMQVVEMENEAALLAGSPIVPSGPGTSVDHGTGAARPTCLDDYDDYGVY